MMASAYLSTAQADDYSAPAIRPERPRAPRRRLGVARSKRRGTIEFMASFLLVKNRSVSEDGPEPPLRRSMKAQCADLKPECPKRRGTMEFLWGSRKHLSLDSSDHGSVVTLGDTKPVCPFRRRTIEFFQGNSHSSRKMSIRDLHMDDSSGETEVSYTDFL